MFMIGGKFVISKDFEMKILETLARTYVFIVFYVDFTMNVGTTHVNRCARNVQRQLCIPINIIPVNCSMDAYIIIYVQYVNKRHLLHPKKHNFFILSLGLKYCPTELNPTLLPWLQGSNPRPDPIFIWIFNAKVSLYQYTYQ